MVPLTLAAVLAIGGPAGFGAATAPKRPHPGGGAVIVGTAGDDTLTGTRSNDVIRGKGGDDIIRGKSGDDRLYGGPGNDTVSGDTGDDLINGGPGRDLLLGGAGDDTIRARDGKRDTIACGKGSDSVVADRNDVVARDCEAVKKR